MQFYLRIWEDTDGNLTLGKLGEWEQENIFEYEAYMGAYMRKLDVEIKQRKKIEMENRRRRLKRR